MVSTFFKRRATCMNSDVWYWKLLHSMNLPFFLCRGMLTGSLTESAANFLCRQSGFPMGARGVSTNGKTSEEHRMDYALWRDTYGGRCYVSVERDCATNATQWEDCVSTVWLDTEGMCDWSDGLVLECRTGSDEEEVYPNPDDVINLHGVGITLMRASGQSANNGTVFLNGTTEGLVCAKGMDQQTAEILCKKAGYNHVMSYNSTRYVSSDKLDCDTMVNRTMTIVAKNLKCSNEHDCSAHNANGDCGVDNALWLYCTNNELDQWELENVTLMRNTPGDREDWNVRTGFEGTVVALLVNKWTGEHRRGLVPYTSSSSTKSSICKSVGKTYSTRTSKKNGWIDDTSDQKLSCGYITENGMGYVLSYFYCPSYYNTDVSQCRYTIAPEGWTDGVENALWMDC